MIWAIKSDRAVWIDQRWLSETWEKLTGARVVYIKRISRGSGNLKRIGRYCVQQYLAGQNAIVRVSWSWWRSGIKLSQSFKFFFKECKQGFFERRLAGESLFTETLTWKEMLKGWSILLSSGAWYFGGAWFFLTDNGIDVCYEA